MRTSRLVFMAILLALILGPTTAANAWVIGNLWPNTNNLYYTTTNTLSQAGVTSFGNANLTWNNVSGASKDIYRSGSNTQTDLFENGYNEVTKKSVGNTGELMRTRVYLYNGYACEFDIRINTYYAWSNSADPNCFDVQNVATHEIGHALWANDIWNSTQVEPRYSSQYREVTMYFDSSPGETKKRDLHQDDINGFLAAY